MGTGDDSEEGDEEGACWEARGSGGEETGLRGDGAEGRAETRVKARRNTGERETAAALKRLSTCDPHPSRLGDILSPLAALRKKSP